MDNGLLLLMLSFFHLHYGGVSQEGQPQSQRGPNLLSSRSILGSTSCLGDEKGGIHTITMKGLVCFSLLKIADVVTTYLGVSSREYAEINPCIFYVNKNPSTMFFSLVLIPLLVLYAYLQRRMCKRLSWAERFMDLFFRFYCCCFLLVVVANNVLLF